MSDAIMGLDPNISTTDATIYTTLSSVTDLCGILIGFLLIERFPRRFMFLTGYAITVVTMFVFFICAVSKADYMYKFLILFYRFIFSMGVESIFWGYDTFIYY